MTTVEILRGAKVELARRGLHKGGFFASDWGEDDNSPPPDGPCCVRGACIAVTGDINGDESNTLTFLREAARAMGAAGPESFNDRPATTIDDVQALLDRAITLAEGK